LKKLALNTSVPKIVNSSSRIISKIALGAASPKTDATVMVDKDK